MKDYILGGVANVHMFDGDKLLGNAITTLTDSGMNISISAEEIRGGKGAALLGRYFHSTGMTLTLTNATFNLEYLGLSVGATLESGAEIMKQEQVACNTDTVLQLSNAPIPPRGCGSIAKAWVKDDDQWIGCNVVGISFAYDGAVAGNTYCVKYFYVENSASTITVKSDFVPKTLHLIMDADLYVTGDSACAAQTKAGTITIDVPAFQLNGNQDLTMNMTGAATINLEGTTLAVSDGGSSCNGEKYYAKISQFEENASWTDDIMSIVAEQNTVRTGDNIDIYAVYRNKTPIKITEDMLNSGGNELIIADNYLINNLVVPSIDIFGKISVELALNTSFKTRIVYDPETDLDPAKLNLLTDLNDDSGETRLISTIPYEGNDIDEVIYTINVDGIEQSISVDSIYDSMYYHDMFVRSRDMDIKYFSILDIGNISSYNSVVASVKVTFLTARPADEVTIVIK